MFETWSEQTRRVIFFARYEASKLGASKVESTHLVLGLLREAKAIFFKLKIPPGKLVMIQEACANAGAGATPTATSVDMALH
ncbi:MAG TPA: hypothetical protein VKL40_06765 [Candidatus Angelobacter sp.]|nr:hypothetical protein [Candidatus Angelobacter sp.]